MALCGKILCLFMLSIAVVGLALARERDLGLFGGRVAKIYKENQWVRIYVPFSNSKYILKGDKLTFWDESLSSKRCNAYVVGKGKEHFLMKVPLLDQCLQFTSVDLGVYLRFYGEDFIENIAKGRKLVEILLKKRLALLGKLKRREKEMKNQQNKVDVINQKYKILRDKLELEWRAALDNVETERLQGLKKYSKLENRLLDINRKLEKYRIHDETRIKDLWALDRRVYFPK